MSASTMMNTKSSEQGSKPRSYEKRLRDYEAAKNTLPPMSARDYEHAIMNLARKYGV